MKLFKRKRDPMVEHLLNEISNFEITEHKVCGITKNLTLKAKHKDFKFEYEEVYHNHIVWELLVMESEFSGRIYTLSYKDATEIKNKLCEFSENEQWFKSQAENIEIGEKYFTQKLKEVKR